MEKNPYIGFLNLINQQSRECQSTYFRTGTVLQGEDKEIQIIDVNGIPYRSKENELQKAKGISLDEGDKLLMLTLDNDQTMIILCKLEEV
ncbi:hypothetical protein [Eubacterium ventriosum]|uniref:hypothetical protein n=1 Tax=Eubacterium ventriosum TaxID=39496 RepID=UPI00352173EF